MAGYLEVNEGLGQVRHKALEDAKKMQTLVDEDCRKAGKPSPAYKLTELTGKGSFGRVYKAKDMKTAKLVAVKIIDVDEGDTFNPKLADTYSEFMKEINALQLLSEGGAQNINHVIEALPVGKAMWMVTEYCAGGSVATLMKPTAPGGLQEKWIIPILREVAVAIFWVHKQGIIHRDLKCANVLVTEVGGVQLCDFGVAGMMETKHDKRSTMIGTLHWMAPELFDQEAQYGNEVDIWAFGSMAFEIASGLPPHARAGVGIPQFGDFLREHIPRLEGNQFSDELKDLVSFCLVEDPAHRPSIEEIQQHPYIHDTGTTYPNSSLSQLVKAYKLWEDHGGNRKSLFGPGGAQPQDLDLESTPLADEWNFSTTLAFDKQIHDEDDFSEAEAVRDVYGTAVDFPGNTADSTTPRAKNAKGRRRPPPQVLNALKAPLEKVFDPNTISNYDENSRMYYGFVQQAPPPASDLPLRDDSLHQTLRESLIDLDASLGADDLASFADMNTIKPAAPVGGGGGGGAGRGPGPGAGARPGPRPGAGAGAGAGGGAGPRASMDNSWSFAEAFGQAPLSDPDLNTLKHDMGWQWPSSATTQPPASAQPETTSFAMADDVDDEVSPGSARPRLIHQNTEPIGLPSQGYELQVPQQQPQQPHHAPGGSVPPAVDRMSMASLIDLDMSMPDDYLSSSLPDLTRPSTAISDVGSITGSEVGGGGPFELERHSVYAPAMQSSGPREPSIYVSEDMDLASVVSSSAMKGRESPGGGGDDDGTGVPPELDTLTAAANDRAMAMRQQQRLQQQYHHQHQHGGEVGESPSEGSATYLNEADVGGGGFGLPLGMVPPPSASVMEGRATAGDVANEMRRLIDSLSEHLAALGNQVGGMEPREPRSGWNSRNGLT